MIARCLAHHDYSPVHIPTQKDEQVKEFIRMRDDHYLALKRVKQQIHFLLSTARVSLRWNKNALDTDASPLAPHLAY